MLKVKASLILCCALLTSQFAYAQNIDTIAKNIAKQLNYYQAKTEGAALFVHLDKTVYVNNEAIWFAAYLLNCTAENIDQHQVLSAALINNNDQSIVTESRFVMQAGLGCGNVIIPDSISPGNYSFIAFTNVVRNGKPCVVFVQPVTIKSATQPAFNAEITLDTLYKQPGNMRVMLSVSDKGLLVDGAVVNYYLGKDAQTRIAAKAKTNALGMVDILIPKNRVTAAQHMLEVQVKYAKEIKTLHLKLPVPRQADIVKFYPEGGHLINGVLGKVGWEVKTPGGAPIKTRAILYADHKMLDTIETDSYGMGLFYIVPGLKVNYGVKLLQDDTTDVYTLPSVLSDGVTLRMPNALAADTLRLMLSSNLNMKIIVLVHNYKRVFSTTALNILPNGRLLKIDLTGVPRGLTSLTVLDSLQRPCAERLFFAHYNQKPSVNINADKAQYGTRQKVTVKLKLNDLSGKPANGIVSVACVQDNRFEIKNQNNIELYAYLKNEIDDMPLKDNIMGATSTDQDYLNELLMIRGWSKYKWPELAASVSTDTVKNLNNALFTGNVTWFDETLKKPVSLVVMRDSTAIQLLNTDTTGNFKLTYPNVYTLANKKVRLIVNGKSAEYTIKVNDPFTVLNQQLAKTVQPVIYQEPITQSTAEFSLKGFEHSTHLHEVKIVAYNDNSIWKKFGSNACGDYVCRYNILNCTNHIAESDNTQPVNGKTYRWNGGFITYRGCTLPVDQPGMLSFKGIYNAVEFYSSDYSSVNSTEPDYLSTIYWAHTLKVAANNTTEISFYTSDITGKYRIVVQGLTNQDVVYGEGAFTVKKNKP